MRVNSRDICRLRSVKSRKSNDGAGCVALLAGPSDDRTFWRKEQGGISLIAWNRNRCAGDSHAFQAPGLDVSPLPISHAALHDGQRCVACRSAYPYGAKHLVANGVEVDTMVRIHRAIPCISGCSVRARCDQTGGLDGWEVVKHARYGHWPSWGNLACMNNARKIDGDCSGGPGKPIGGLCESWD